MNTIYFLSMKRIWNHAWWLLALVALATGGCSGINASKSISPLDFLLPGLHLQNDPAIPVLPGSAGVLVCWNGTVSPHYIP